MLDLKSISLPTDLFGLGNPGLLCSALFWQLKPIQTFNFFFQINCNKRLDPVKHVHKVLAIWIKKKGKKIKPTLIRVLLCDHNFFLAYTKKKDLCMHS